MVNHPTHDEPDKRHGVPCITADIGQDPSGAPSQCNSNSCSRDLGQSLWCPCRDCRGIFFACAVLHITACMESLQPSLAWLDTPVRQMVSRWISYLPHLSQPEQPGNLCEGSNWYQGRSLRDFFVEDELWHPGLAHGNCTVWPLKHSLIKMDTQYICVYRFSYWDTMPHSHGCTTSCPGLAGVKPALAAPQHSRIWS